MTDPQDGGARVSVTLTEPVATGTGPRSDFRNTTHTHIPGSVLRGALAAAWIARNPDRATTEPEFLEVFEGEGSFGPLHSPASLPVPLSVLLHKYDPTERCRRLWWDEALGEQATRCDRCDSPLVASKGQTVGEVGITGRTSASLDTEGVAIDGKLFHYSTLTTGTRLTGWIHGPAVRSLRHDGEPVSGVLLGSRRSVRGAATLELHDDTVAEPVETARGHVVLRLASPGVFVDAYGLPHHEPDTDELADLLGVATVTVEKSWTRWTDVGGWHTASGLPKPTDRAVAAGSTYLLRCTPRLPSEQALRILATRGIGLRRREGYGALYRTPPAPLGFAAFTGAASTLRPHVRLHPLLRERSSRLRLGSEEDPRFAAMLPHMPDHLADALRTVLSVTDATRYDRLLDYLETGR